jgi:hypothetical protein
MDWRDAPPYGRSGATDAFVARYRARCYCGAIEYEVRADPVDAKLCHCPACQTLHGAPFQWAVIFHKTDVCFVRGVEELYFYNSELDRPGHVLPCKLGCQRCRSPVADEGRRMFLAFGPLFDFGMPPRVPAAFQPTCHIFYGSRVIDVDDGKPKYLGHKGSSPLVDPTR